VIRRALRTHFWTSRIACASLTGYLLLSRAVARRCQKVSVAVYHHVADSKVQQLCRATFRILHTLPTKQHASRSVRTQLEQKFELCIMDSSAQPISRLCPAWTLCQLVVYAICAMSISALTGPSAISMATGHESGSGCIFDIGSMVARHLTAGPPYSWALIA
jgi:hypothetical protein